MKADLERYAAVALKTRIVPIESHIEGQWRKQWVVEIKFGTQENAKAFLAALRDATPTLQPLPQREP